MTSFSSSTCSFQDRTTKMMIGKCIRISGQYHLQPFVGIISVNIICQSPSIDIWRCRLGHLSIDNFKLLCSSFPFIYSNFYFQFNVFLQEKHTSLPFYKFFISSSYAFSLIHCDIWGPFFISNTSGARFFNNCQ